MTSSAARAARDGEQFKHYDNGQTWLASWHPAALGAPQGTRHGSAAVCFVSEDEVILVSEDGELWQLPGGRPEGDEDWRATLDREVLEEACAHVEDATLLGYARSECISGRQQAEVLVRSFWRARVTLLPWDPQNEILRTLLAPPDQALATLNAEPALHPIYRRIFEEAGIR